MSERVAKNVRIPVDYDRRLKAIAERRHVSVNLLITLAIEGALTEWESRD